MEFFHHITATFDRWLAYTGDQLTDSSFWWGIVTALGLLAATVAIASVRGVVSPLSTFASRLGNGFYYYYHRSYPDIISAASHILLTGTDGKAWLYLDTIFSERNLLVVMWNPYKAFLLRQTAGFACAADPLIRLNHYGPKKRRWWRRRQPLSAAQISALRVKIRQRYRSLYRPLVTSVSEHYTNNDSIRASRGEAIQVMRMVLAKTYMGKAEMHHRIHIIHEWQFLQWPQECPLLARESYRERHELTLWLRKMYRRYPWRFDVVHDFVPPERVPPGFLHWQRERGGETL